MANIALAGRRVGGDIGIGAGHLLLIYTDDLGEEFILSAYTDNNLFSGDLFVETHAGSAWVPRALSTESTIDDDLFAAVEIDFGGRDPADVQVVLDQFALEIDAQSFSYSALNRNSNSVIGTLLDLVGIDVGAFLPNPPDVGFLGFVARDEFLRFGFEIAGSPGGDFVRSQDFSQTLGGGEGDDHLVAGAGDDLLIGGLGNDTLDGGEGRDTAMVGGPQGGFTVTLSVDSVTVEDRRPGEQGIDLLTGIEVLDFGGPASVGLLDLERFGGMAALSADELSDFIALYIAYFGRAPDALGLNFWGTAFADGMGLEEIAALFATQVEYLAAYPEGTTNSDFATAVYGNVIGRLPDTDGLNFWVGLLDQGAVGRDQFILAVLDGVKGPPKPELGQDFVDQQAADRAFLETRIDIGAYFAVHKGLSDVAEAVDVMGLFDGSGSSLEAAVAAVDGYHADALDPVTGDFLLPLIGVLDDPFAVA